MAGDFSDAIRPTLPGAYTRYIAQRPAAQPPAPGNVIAVPITHDWGPLDVPTLVTDYGMFQELFGIGGVVSDTPGSRAIYDAFRGEGVLGLGGAAGVIVSRFAGSAAAKASIALTNPTPVAALSVTTKYETSKAAIKVVVSPIVSNVQTVDVYDGTSQLETYTYATNVAPALAGLRDLINKTSKVLVATLTLEGTTGLTAGTFTLTGGNDGTTLLAADWTAVWDTFANDNFSYIAPFNVAWSDLASEPSITNRAIIAGLTQWLKDENKRGHRVSAVVGVAIDASTVTSLALGAACATEFVIAVGGAGVNDDLWGGLSTAQLAPRIAGIYANRGETMAAHFARLAGTLPRPKPGGGATSTADAEALTNGGVVAIMRDRFADAPTRLVKSVNTYSADTTNKPRIIYGNPKFVLSMQQFANDVEADAEVNLIGRVVLTPATRSAIAARALRIARAREPLAFAEGTTVTALPGDDTDEFVVLDVRITFGRALAQLFIQANVR